jgi:hypothetical protein
MKNRIIVFLQIAGILKDRSIKQILELMLKHQHLFRDGLCMWASRLYSYGVISPKEYIKLKAYLRYNEPNLKLYWFERGDIHPRIKWIEKQILKNK